MALPAGAQRLIVQARARDPLGTANTPTLIWDLFTRLQWAVNAQIEDVVGSYDLPLNARQVVYQINANIPAAQKIIGVRDAGKDLYPMEFDVLRGYDLRWFRQTGDYLRWFSLCGYDLLIVGPALDSLQEAQSVEVLYNAVTATIASDTDTFQIQDENVQSVMELTEAILLAKARDWPEAAQALQRAVKSLGLEGIALRDMGEGVPPTTEGTE
jgi:hypothetical protein